MSWIADPLSDPIMRRAALELILLGVAGGVLGCWLVLYELAYGAESLAHALFPGLVAAALLGLPLVVGGAAGIVAAGLAVAVAARAPAIGRDNATAVVVTTLLGAGVLLALSQESPPGLGELLFGDVLGVTDGDLALAGGLALALVVALRLLHGRLLAVGFDRTTARSIGASPLVADAALLVLLALAILVGVQGLGNLLVVAVLIGPAATGRQLARRIAPMMAWAVGAAIVAGLGGLLLSYHAGTAAGASVALVAVALWAAAWASRRAIVSRTP
ncbi:MAG TPA: metal ABC transporter permease [Capillimicrobium sp.]|nr:metal ABC transporter permease [Capillimicrobium sp.]